MGEDHERAKLTREEVREAFRLHHTEGYGAAWLGNRYGVHRTTMRQIFKRESWREATEDLTHLMDPGGPEPCG